MKEVSRNGLTSEETRRNFLKYGPNEIRDNSKISALNIFFRQIKKNFVIYLLLFTMILSFSVGKQLTAYVILGVIVVVISTGFVQEYRAERAIIALKKMIVPVSIVIRNGKEQEINSNEIVPGDLVVLRNGEKIPADCIVVKEKDLLVNESILTGESKEVGKKITDNYKDYKDENVVFAGTYIVNGKCLAVVMHTGMNTRFGKIAGLISSVEKDLPLQRKVNKIAKYMAIFGITFATLSGIFMIIKVPGVNSEIITNAILVSISVAVASFPEGFPVVLITSLASGSYRMAKKNAIVNRMSIIETLGETTVICSDKTGTITKGEMTVKKIFCNNSLLDVSGTGYEGQGEFLFNGKKLKSAEEKSLDVLLKAGLACNDSRISRTGEDMMYSISGSPTEAALLIAGAKANMFKEDFNFERIEEIPFNSSRKMMSVLVKERDGIAMYSKGAPEILLKNCKYIQRNNGVFRLNDKERKNIIKLNLEITARAYRTLGLAYKKTNSKNKSEIEKDLIFIGFVALEDPPREEIANALMVCKKAGVKVKMITGDSRETAVSIARQIGLDRGKILEGVELDNVTDEELKDIVREVVIFSRVRPEQKLRIVRALKQNGEIVTMTGDGVNDAPALKEAHIGVAMGINGTDVSRSVADLTLKDDNFATIVDAIKEGRTIFNNIQKFSTYQISINFSQVSLIFLSILIGMPLPLIAIQILFMNLFSDEITAITLAFNPYSKDVMNAPPRKKSEIINKHLLVLVIISGLIISIGSLAVFKYALSSGLDEQSARTVVFATMVLFGITNAFNFRSFRKTTIGRSLFTNRALFCVSLFVLTSLLVMIYTPIGKIFELVSIDYYYLLIALAVSLSVVVLFDLFKYINHKKQIWEECSY